MAPELEVCPNCRYVLLERTTYCPHCGAEISYPFWKKLGAWILLVLIGYGLVTCYIRMLDGFDQL